MRWLEIAGFFLFALPLLLTVGLDIWGDVAGQLIDVWKDLRSRWKE